MLYFIFILAARLKISSRSPIYRFITAPCQKKCIISAVKRSKINYIYTRLWAILECFQETVLLQNYISISENALSFLNRRFFWWSSKESLKEYLTVHCRFWELRMWFITSTNIWKIMPYRPFCPFLIISGVALILPWHKELYHTSRLLSHLYNHQLSI